MKIEIINLGDERTRHEMTMRGFLYGAQVIVDDEVFDLYFVTPHVISQKMSLRKSRGKNYWAQTGTVVLDAVTEENIEMAVRELANEGYFVRQPTARKELMD